MANDSTGSGGGVGPLGPGGDGRKLPPRKLGRGLDALLSVPVEINLPGSPRAGVAPQGAQPATGAAVPTPRTDGSEQRPDDARSDVPRGTSPSAGSEPRDQGRTSGGSPASRPGSSGDVPSASDASAALPREGAGDGGLVQIAVDQLRPNTRQPRQDFDEAGLAALAESIRSAGLMQPIVARPLRDGSFEIVAGERRWRAARRIGLMTIPTVLRHVDDQTAAEWALIENIQREDLNPMERATALRRLADEFGLTHQQLGDRVGLDRATVTNLLRLSELDPFTSDAVRRGKLSQGHAKALLAISRVDHRQTLAAAAISGDWSVRELERRVQQTNRQIDPVTKVSPGATAVRNSAHLEDLERRLSEHLGSRVTIQLGRKKGSGRLSVDFFSLDQFDGILAKLGFAPDA